MKITVMNRNDATTHSLREQIPTCVIVSISCLEDEYPSFVNSKYRSSKVKDVFAMKFNDLEKDYKVSGLKYIGPKQENLNGLKAFIDKYKDEVEEIIVHCSAGISRSSATAAAIGLYLNQNDDFIWNDIKYCPNRLVYKLARNEFGITTTEEEYKNIFYGNDKLQASIELPEELKDNWL